MKERRAPRNPGGRPRGIVETKPRNTLAKRMAETAVAEGITPLEVMLTAMREDWEAARAMLSDQVPENAAEAEKWTSRIMKLREAAIATADRAAPYIHARLQSTDMTMKSDNVHRVVSDKPVTEDEWVAEHAANDAAKLAPEADKRDVA